MMHTLVRISALVVATHAALALSFPGHARACSLAFNEEHVVNSEEEAVDTTPPGVPDLREITVFRRPARSGSPSSCNGSGSIRIAVGAPTDDRSPVAGIGYLVEIDGVGIHPRELPAGAVQADDSGVVWLHFADHDQDIDLTLSVRAMDLGGNLGEPATVQVTDPGSGGGCSAGGSAGSTSLALVMLALAAALRRRRGAFRG